MAQVPNMVYPHAKSPQYNATVFHATSMFTGSTFSGSHAAIDSGTVSGSALYYKGCEILRGFTASGSIQKYQPVVAVYNTPTTSYYVYGSIAAGTQCIGVSDAVYTTGQSANVIVRGAVPMNTSGSSVSALGVRVTQCLSGATYTYVADYVPTLAGLILSGSIGRCISTGAGGANVGCIILVNPD